MPGILRSLELAEAAAGRALARRLDSLELTRAEIDVLFHLHHAAGDEAAMRAVLRSFRMPASTLTSVVDRLERRGLAARSRHPRDRRSLLVELTPAGREAAATVRREIGRLEEAVKERLAPADLAGFRAVIAALEAAGA